MNSRERKRVTGFLNLVCQVHLHELESTLGRHLEKSEASKFNLTKKLTKLNF